MITTAERELTTMELLTILGQQTKQFFRLMARYIGYYVKPRQERAMAFLRGLTMARYKAWLDAGDGDIITMTDKQVITASIIAVFACLLLSIAF